MESLNKDSREVHLGRFVMSAPKSSEDSGRRWRLRHVDIIELDWPDEGNREESRHTLWQEQIQRLEAISIKIINKEQPTIEVIEPNEEGLWYKQSLYYDHGKNIQRLKWDIIADMGSHAVLFSMDKGEKIKEVMDSILTTVREAYQAYPANQAIVYQPQVFYMEKGAIHLEFDNNERVWAAFRDDELGYVMKIEIRTNKASGEVNLIERTQEMAKAFKAEKGFNIETLRSGKRRVAGLEGEEVLTRVQEIYRGEPSDELSFQFHYNGEFETPDKPDIRIELESSAEKLQEKIALWDAMLNSMHYVGE